MYNINGVTLKSFGKLVKDIFPNLKVSQRKCTRYSETRTKSTFSTMKQIKSTVKIETDW